MAFIDRSQAGKWLAEALTEYRGHTPVVLALPRGGVPVAFEIARALQAPLDLVLVRKIGVPMQPELAMGAVVDGVAPLTVRNEDVIAGAAVSDSVFRRAEAEELAFIERRRALYLGKRPHPRLTGHVAIVVDDGIATGATARAALLAVRKQKPARLVLAVPVAPSSTLAELRGLADEIVCLEDHEAFVAVGSYYQHFDQVTDEEVRRALASAPASARRS